MEGSPNMAAHHVSDLQRSAFWIYGVTALVMREPMATVIAHASSVGLGNWQVQLELLRVAVILILLSRLFLMSGLFLEKVYMLPNSDELFPRRSYPIDFLAGLFQFLLATAASSALALNVRVAGVYSPFSVIIAILLLFDLVWLAISALRRFSTTDLVARQVLVNVMLLVTSGVIASTARLAGLDAVFSEGAGLTVLALLAMGHMAIQIVSYEGLG
jgi:hypothetical protein